MGDAYAALMFEDNTNFLECVGRRAAAELFITHLGADVVWGDQPAVLLRGVVTIIGHSTFHVEVRASQYDNWDFSGRKSGTRVVHRLFDEEIGGPTHWCRICGPYPEPGEGGDIPGLEWAIQTSPVWLGMAIQPRVIAAAPSPVKLHALPRSAAPSESRKRLRSADLDHDDDEDDNRE